MRSARFALGGLVVAALVAIGSFRVATGDLADVELRTRPAHARPTAWLSSAHPLVQRLRPTMDGLRRVDVALSGAGGMPLAGRLRLTIARDGEVLRTAEADLAGAGRERAAAAPFQWVGFEVEPIPNVAGEELVLELAPAGDDATLAVQAWMRAGRMPGYRDDRGTVAHQAGAARTFEGSFESWWSRLSAVGFATRVVTPGRVRLELWDELDPAVRRVVEVDRAGSRRGGSLLLPLAEEIEASRYRTFRWRLEVPAGTVLSGDAAGPSVAHYHGPRRPAGAVAGADGTGWPDGEADLVLRTRAQVRPLARLAERAGLEGATGRLVAAALAWLLAGALAGLGLAAATRPAVGSAPGVGPGPG